MEDIQEIQYTPITILLTFGEYFKINHSVSLSEGFDISDSTARYWGVNPRAAKTNIQVIDEVETYEPKLVLDVDTYIQRKYPELLVGFEPVDSYIPVDSPVQELFIDITSSTVLYWTLIQFSVSGSREEGLVLKISPETQLLISPEMIEVIQSLGMEVQL